MKSRGIILSLLLVFLFSSFSTAYSDQAKPSPEPHFSKPFAIFLSVVSPGLGQIYTGQLGKGISVWGASSILVMGFLTTGADFDFRSTGGAFPFNIGMQFKPVLTTEETFWAVSLGVTYAFLYVYNILDISLYENQAVTVLPTSDGFTAEFSVRF